MKFNIGSTVKYGVKQIIWYIPLGETKNLSEKLNPDRFRDFPETDFPILFSEFLHLLNL